MPADLTAPVNGVLTYLYFGDNTELSRRYANRSRDASEEAEVAAASATTSAGYAEEFSGPAYATIAAGEAATATGHFFRVPIAGTNPVEYKRYQRTAGGSVEAAPLASSAALAAPGGAAMVGNAAFRVAKVTDIAAMSIPASVTSFAVAGYYAEDDGGAHGRAVGTSDQPDAKQSADGRWWVVADLFVRPEMFGAIGNGAIDDTAALRKFVNCSPYRIHRLTSGKTYIVDPGVPTTAPGSVILPLARGIELIGDDATIKVKDGAGGYYAIIGSNDVAVDLSGLSITRTRFDHNALNGTGFVATGNVLTYPRFTVSARRFPGGAEFNDNVVDNASQTNSVYFNAGANGKRSRCSRNKFLNVGANPTNTVHDYSAYYLVGDDIRAEGNRTEGAYWGAPGAVCAGEVHPGTGCEVHFNTWDKMRDGLNIAGSYAGGDSKYINVSRNDGDSIRVGIRCFSAINAGHTTGYGLDDCNIDFNTMRIRNTLATGTTGVSGVVLEAGATLPTRGVRIRNNVAIFEVETTPPAYTGVAPAFGSRETGGSLTHEEFVLDGNRAINAPGPGWAIGLGGGVFVNPSVGAQEFMNCAQGLSTSMIAAYRYAGVVFPNEIRGTLPIGEQTITDTFAVTKLVGALTFSPVADSTSADISCSFSLVMSGDKASFLQPVTNSGSRTKPLVDGTVNSPWSPSAHTFRANSQIRDTANAITRRVMVEGTSWNREDYGSSAPSTGSWSAGDLRTNPAPTAGGTDRWRCVVAGTPGTWKAISISA